MSLRPSTACGPSSATSSNTWIFAQRPNPIRSRSTSSTIATHSHIFSSFTIPSFRRAAHFSWLRASTASFTPTRVPRLAEDLRHEATHALLHGSFGALPLWLDEGLAEYFENDLSTSDSERERIDHLITDLKSGWSPDLGRLQTLSDIRQMTPRDYREAWGWVHLFLKDSIAAKVPLGVTLAEFGAKPDRVKLADRLAQSGATNDRLQAHLKTCQSRFLAATQPASDPSVRLQDRMADSSPGTGPADSRGLLRRIRAWIGL